MDFAFTVHRGESRANPGGGRLRGSQADDLRRPEAARSILGAERAPGAGLIRKILT